MKYKCPECCEALRKVISLGVGIFQCEVCRTLWDIEKIVDGKKIRDVEVKSAT